MTPLKIACAALVAVGSLAATTAPAAASPMGGHQVRVCKNVRVHHHWERVCHWESRRGHWVAHHRGHRVEVCRSVRYHHHWRRVCHIEYRRW